uniref:C2H2-type domain-containing protein n=1 Tax=Marseillevirus LCMAC202 TaxID=2506606 RepID=A0A481YZB9_9VIRU|nr:MAG: hypothetical protein LCMAC202_02250 [Marseillevirus LCMAC202]
MVNYTCEHCKHVFAERANLLKHQKRAKYCLQIRGLEKTTYTCACGKIYTRNDSLQRHHADCQASEKPTESIPTTTKEDKQEELLCMVINKYGDMVKDLQKQITDLSTRPVNTNSNNRIVLQNLQPITDEVLQEHLIHLTLNFIQEGAKGYADFAGTYPFKDKVMCTDRSRKKLKYKDADGELTDDGRILAQRFFKAISERNTEILNQAYADLHSEVKDIVAENRAGDVNITSILTKATTLQDILIKSQKAARGEDDDFAQEFLTHLTKML